MAPLELKFEVVRDPQTFVHVRSRDGILGHAAEFRERVPPGTFLTVQPAYQPAVTWWLLKHGGCDYLGRLLVAGEPNDVLMRRRRD